MCLILFAWRAHPRYPLVLAANRDEFHRRPAAAAHWWPDSPAVLAGRDLQAGGTWLGVTRTGHFAAVTNFREPLTPEIPLERSRGDLVRDYLLDGGNPGDYAQSVQRAGGDYRGFNLLVGSPGALWCASNRQRRAREVAPGVHGLSNHLLDTDWPKVGAGRRHLQALMNRDRVQADDLLALLTDRRTTPGEMPQGLPDDELRRQLMNHYFIVSPDYGTRSSTVVLLDVEGGMELVERRFAPDGQATGTDRFRIEIEHQGVEP